MVQNDFTTSIPIKIVKGVIIVPVSIYGNQYSFAFDTGAPNVISERLANELGLLPIVYVNSDDANGTSKEIAFTKIDEIILGDLSFIDHAAGIYDFDESSEISCLEIDGILGANLMRSAVWQIDMKNEVLIIASDLDHVKLPLGESFFNFKPEISGTPKISLSLDSKHKYEDVVFDYGSTRGIDLFEEAIPTKISKIGNNPERFFGATSVGLFEDNQVDTIFCSKNDVKLGELELKNCSVYFEGQGTSTLGTKILKDFVVTIDWDSETIFFNPNYNPKYISNNDEYVYGLKLKRQENYVIVTGIFENSPAFQNGLRVGDKVLFINEENILNLTESQYCYKSIKGFFDGKNGEQLLIVLDNVGNKKEIRIDNIELF